MEFWVSYSSSRIWWCNGIRQNMLGSESVETISCVSTMIGAEKRAPSGTLFYVEE